MTLHPTALKVQERLRERGLEIEVQVLPDSTRTAVDAAAACGCELGQIVKSLVFLRDEERVVCLWAGDRQVPAEELGLRRASADEVREATGFAVGGVPPLGHDRPLTTLVDDSLRRFYADLLRLRRDVTQRTYVVEHPESAAICADHQIVHMIGGVKHHVADRRARQIEL